MIKKFNIKSKALQINKENKKIKLIMKTSKIFDLKKDELIIKLKFSNINYKDYLLSIGGHGLIKRYPHIPGIDAAGLVVKSNSKKFKLGDKVIIVAKPFGIQSNGGFSQYAKLNSKWAYKVKKDTFLKKSMIFGTAGFTALVAINKIMKRKKFYSSNPILISGASGGVGLISIIILVKLGFKVHALTRNSSKKNFFKKLGVSKIINNKDLTTLPNLPLLKMQYSSIIDCIGGEFIYTATRVLHSNGSIFLIGNTAGELSKINILPFILRGINLFGINAENITDYERKKVINQMKKYSKIESLNLIYTEYKFSETIKALKKFKNKNNYKKILIKF